MLKPNICEIASESNNYQLFKFESFPSKSSMSVENYFSSWRERERSVLRSCGHVWIVQHTHTQALNSSGAQHSTVTATSPCFWFNFDCFSFISILCCLYRHNESNIEKTWQLYRSQPSSTLQHGTDGVESFGLCVVVDACFVVMTCGETTCFPLSSLRMWGCMRD